MSTTANTFKRKTKYDEHKLVHYKQRSNWDCGIACVMMILSSEQKENFQDNFSKICQIEGFHKSTWTIDLCYLLKRYDIEHCLYTTVKGVSNTVASNKIKYQILTSFLPAWILHLNLMGMKDRTRVNGRFANADRNGIVIKVEELKLEQLIEHIASKGPAIVLIDATLLVCDWCKYNKLRSEFRRLFGGSYCGHYVVVVGRTSDKILYRNPIFNSKTCATSFANFQTARCVPGTDSDAILIFKDLR